jgi:hypothetical protein
MTHGFDEVRRVADDELLSRLERLVKADRAISVKLLVHLGEVEARKLFLERGYSSMYSYCMTALEMSEGETYLRLLAAKTGKRLPLVLERLADGGLHLTAVKLLAPLLTEENHVALLDRARGMSKREVELLVAELAPKGDVPERMRKLPESRGAASVAAQRAAEIHAPGAAQSRSSSGADVHAAHGGADVHAAHGGADVHAAHGGGEMPGAKAVESSDSPHAGGAPIALSQGSTAAAPFVLQAPPRASTSPLSPGRFKLELTLGQEAHDQLQQLRELLRHQNPKGEITSIIERALRELLERTLKQRFAQTAPPKRHGARARGARALGGVAKSTADSADAHESQPGCSTEDLARDDAAHGCASPTAGHQRADVGVAELDAAARDAREARTGCSTEDCARDDAAHGCASPAAGHPPPAELEPVRGAGADGVRPARTAVSSRYVPRPVLRAIYARDAGQCTYVSADGRRCSARGFLEVHHHEAFARGGEATTDNLRLTCRAHNFWLAEQELGPALMQRKLQQARSRL